MNFNLSILVFWSILQTFALFVIGGVILKKGIIKSEMLPQLTTLGVDVFTPFLTFSAIVGSFQLDTPLFDALTVPLIGFGVMLVGYVLGFGLRYCLFNRSPERIRTMHHLCTINNYMFLPLLIIRNIWPNDGHVVMLMLMNAGATAGNWTLGVVSLSGLQSIKGTIRNICSPNVLAIILGLLVVITGCEVPILVDNLARMLGDMALPFTMILTGASLCHHMKGLFRNLADAAIINFFRLILIPAVCVLILKFLPLGKVAYEVTMIYSLMPSAVISVLLTGKYQGSDEFAGQSIILTTLLSLITVPIWMALLL